MDSTADSKARRCASRIGARIGGGKVVDDPDVMESFAADESHETPRRPAAVIFPRTSSDVAEALRLASESGVFVTPRGGGTGKSGGAVPVRGGLVLSLEKMDAIEEIDAGSFTAVARPGVVLQDLHEAVEKESLFYPPDPASLDSCRLGGNVAANAGGPRAFKYGVTGHYVLSLELVMMDGSVLTAGRRTIKQVCGYNLVPLMIGSEGTLAVFTLITVRLVPLPEKTATCVASFASGAGAVEASGRLLRAAVVPRVMEVMDRRCMEVMQRCGEVHFEEDASSVLLIEMDGCEADVRGQVDRAGDILDGSGARDLLLLSGSVERGRFWEARRKISDYLKREYPGKVSDDISVPRDVMVETVDGIYDIAARRGILSAVYGHAGDGNLHVNFMGPDPLDAEDVEGARDELMKMVLDKGGAVSGEHGIGSIKRKYLGWQLGDGLLELQRSIKARFDPEGLLNPGKIFP